MINSHLNAICFGAQTSILDHARQIHQVQSAKKQSASFERSSFATSLSDMRKKTPEINFTPSAPALSASLREETSQLVSTKPPPKRRQRR